MTLAEILSEEEHTEIEAWVKTQTAEDHCKKTYQIGLLGQQAR